MKPNKPAPLEQSDLGPYCLQYIIDPDMEILFA